MTRFADFIAPFDVAEFRSRHFGRRPLYIPANGRPFANPLPWKRFNELLELAPCWDEHTLKLVYKSRPALIENYCDLTRQKPGMPAPADPRKVMALVGLGASLVANQVQRASPEVAAIAQALGDEFGARCAANVYCSFREVQAFSTHFDLHDVFAVQVEGEKRWHVWETRADNPVNPVPPGDAAEQWLIDSRGKLLLDITMRPGDILYLPRGWFHDAITGAAASLHVTFSVHPATGLSLFKLLEQRAEAESAFRGYVPDARDPAALRAHLAMLGTLLRELAVSPAFAQDVQNLQRGLHVEPLRFDLPAQHRPRWFSPTRAVEIRNGPAGYALVTEQGELQVGAPWQAVDWLLQQGTGSLSDALARFPHVDERELLQAVQALVAHGLLVEVDIA
jgi:bifunctional lysine-specific demethylase and histidyl-hydroxylase NO66